MSRFISFAIPVTSAAEAKEYVALYTNEYHDARHVCWAYMLGSGRKEFLSSDNGEPSGTAGKPILGQINSFGLTNILIIVVRYFGGIKLGTSGLIAAYREAARLAIEAAEIIEGRDMTTLGVTFPYLAMNDVMKLVKAQNPPNGREVVRIIAQEFDNTCSMTLSLPLDLLPELSGRLDAISGTSVCCPDEEGV
ncbi:MAG: YigZ family protein [Duncaniella sp.]|uniref:IMPACT family protein n=1 Tax=Duncaniella sp. TaxID=2518496 RepID=UPI0023D18B2F|nr:YigZ family protein [Duncaniella sp.]MDE5989017.1 YigZ family protein [Duncaniella sp.]MDE6174166.1 YigZ family protein [Duncaniella sp.]